MLDIQKAVRRIIERFIAGMIPLTNTASSGTKTISIESTRRFCIGDKIVVRKSGSIDAELHTIATISDRNTLVVEDNLIANWPSGTGFVQKLLGFESGNTEFLKAVYLGDPAVIQQFPAITIDAKSRTSEWITLESTSEQFEIDITVYVDGLAYHESQYELMHAYVKAIESSLFRSFYPLVEPFTKTTLAEGAVATDTTIKLVDEDLFTCDRGWIFLESVDFLVPNRIKDSLGNGVYELMVPVGKEFFAGDNVVRPRRHIYNTLAYSTTYGTVNKNTMLKAARISYRATEEVKRYAPFIDPLTF